MNNEVENVVEAPQVEAQVSPEVEVKPEQPKGLESLAKHEPSVEEQARAQGWRPKDEFQGNPADWKDAKHFLEIGESWKKQAALARELKELRSQFVNLAEDQAKIQKMEYERAYNDILATKAKMQADPHMNHQDYEKIIQKEMEVKAALAAQAKNPETEITQKIKSSGAWAKFTMLNPWYGKTDPTSQFLQSMAIQYSSQLPIPETEADIDRDLTKVHNYMQQEYGHIIASTKPKPVAKTMPVTYSPSSASDFDYSNFKPAEQATIAYLESRAGTPEQIKESVAAYIKSLPKR